METHPCTEICSKKEATAKNIFRFLEIRKLTYENSKASKLENPSVLIQSLDSVASPSQSTIKIYIP